MSHSKKYSSNTLLEMMDGNRGEVAELAAMLFDLGPKMISEIDKNITTENWKKAADVAHKLKSSLKLWGMTDLIALAVFIETNGKIANETDEIVIQFVSLKSKFLEAIEEMKEEF